MTKCPKWHNKRQKGGKKINFPFLENLISSLFLDPYPPGGLLAKIFTVDQVHNSYIYDYTNQSSERSIEVLGNSSIIESALREVSTLFFITILSKAESISYNTLNVVLILLFLTQKNHQ